MLVNFSEKYKISVMKTIFGKQKVINGLGKTEI